MANEIYADKPNYPAYMQLAVRLAEAHKISLSEAEPMARAMANLRDVNADIYYDEEEGKGVVLRTTVTPLDASASKVTRQGT
jgi:hypothetical protein